MDKLAKDPIAQALGQKPDASKMTTTAIRTAILGWLREHPKGGTGEEIARGLGLDMLIVQRRLSEIKAKGLVQQTAESRPTKRGRPARVWEIA